MRFFAALRFLTVCPAPQGWGEKPEDLSGSLAFFPVVGILIGFAVAGVVWMIGDAIPSLLVGVSVTISLIAVSGGLHTDGLSDAADGLFSARSRERMLEIMRDSHIGAMGVIAIVSVFAIKLASISEIVAPQRWQAVFLMPLMGRCALVIGMAVMPYVRSEGGLGTVFFTHRPVIAAVWAVFVLVGAGYLVGEGRGLVSAAGSLAVILVMSAYFRRKIGGTTGDTLGAICETVECVPALTYSLL